MNNLNKNSLTGGTVPTYVGPTDKGTRATYGSFSKKTSCTSSCSALLVENTSAKLNLIGKLLIKNSVQILTSYGVPESSV